jgi:Ca2+-binding RTX toxin-like protein
MMGSCRGSHSFSTRARRASRPLVLLAVSAVAASLLPAPASAAVHICGREGSTIEGTDPDLVPVIVGSDGNDTLKGTKGQDVIVGLGGNDRILGLGGNDYLCGNEGDDFLDGGVGRDFLSGDQGSDESHGSEGNDRITGYAPGCLLDLPCSDDTMYGDAGNDYLHGSEVQGTMYGGPGNDRIDGAARYELHGGEGDDHISASESDDTVYGDGGNDIILRLGGKDTIRGGDGNDTLGILEQNLQYDAENNPDNQRDLLIAGGGNDRILGSRDTDVITADAGDDWIDGAASEDVIDGGEGQDLVDYHLEAHSSLEVVLDANSAVIDHNSAEPIVDIESVIGSPGDDVLVGNNERNFFDGRDGIDLVEAGAAQDTCFNTEKWLNCENLGPR